MTTSIMCIIHIICQYIYEIYLAYAWHMTTSSIYLTYALYTTSTKYWGSSRYPIYMYIYGIYLLGEGICHMLLNTYGVTWWWSDDPQYFGGYVISWNSSCFKIVILLSIQLKYQLVPALHSKVWIEFISIFSALPGWLIISGLFVSRFALSLLVSDLLAAFKNSKLINFDLELCIRKFEANQFQIFQHYRDNDMLGLKDNATGESASWFVFSLLVSCG